MSGSSCAIGQCKSNADRSKIIGDINKGQFGCFLKIPNCWIYADTSNNVGTCNTCLDGYRVHEGKCVECRMDMCAECIKDNQCLTCVLGVPSYDKSKCVTCGIQNCLACSADNVCAQCAPQYSLYGGQCIPCSDANCQECRQKDTCYKCKNDMIVPTGGTKCVVKIADCTTQSSDGSKCVTCNSGFKPYNSGCVRCPIDQCDYCAKAGICSACLNGRVPTVNNDGCVDQIPYCKDHARQGVCQTCIDEYKPNGSGGCNKCTIANCAECSQMQVCSKCEDHYKVIGGGTGCELQCEVENCFQCNKYNECAQCGLGYGVNNNTKQCDHCEDSTCKYCDGDRTKCVTYFTKEELEGKKVPWWAWLLVGIGAALLVGFIIFMIVWCCRDPVSLTTEYEENYDEYDKASRSGSSARSSSEDASSDGEGREDQSLNY
ncbi:hypothetical protein, conserved [Angomonas deanei]|uniref:Uncharacterized protein n=1 Tax=Angomonas deanei TaxID=59799 RepID=A0A7G2C8S7_9TRYP|nr:hypothetical protein, conserved [Angomonas deanei]